MRISIPFEEVWALIAVLAAFFILMNVVIARCAQIYREVVRSHEWVTAPARKLTARVYEEVGISQTRYVVKVSYSFRVEKQRFDGTRVAIGYEGSLDAEAEQELADRLNETVDLQVRYDPEDPRQSCLTCISPAKAFSPAYVAVPIFLMLMLLACLTWYLCANNNVLLDSLDVK